MDFVDLPLLDVLGMRVRKIEKPLREMPDDRVLMQELLVVEPLGKNFTCGGGADQRALIGKGQFFLLDPASGLLKKTRLPGFLHIKEQYSGIDIVRLDEVFSVVVRACGVLDRRDVRIIK